MTQRKKHYRLVCERTICGGVHWFSEVRSSWFFGYSWSFVPYSSSPNEAEALKIYRRLLHGELATQKYTERSNLPGHEDESGFSCLTDKGEEVSS